MIKKLIFGALFAIVGGALIIGGVIRTNAKTGDDQLTGTGGRGHNAEWSELEALRAPERGGRNQPLSEANVDAGGKGRNRSDSNSGVAGVFPDVPFAGEVESRGNGYRGGPTQADGGSLVESQVVVEASGWITLNGSVISAETDLLTIALDDGSMLEIEGRAWRFAQEEGFTTSAGNRLSLIGFYEEDEFEIGQISDLTSGQVVSLREEDGRPNWAGRGRAGRTG